MVTPPFRLGLSFALFLTLLAVANAQAGANSKPPPPCAVSYPTDAAEEWQCRRLEKGETLEGLFGDRWVDVARFNRIDRRHAYPGMRIKVPARLEDLADFTPMPIEYPHAEADEKFILVDLSEQFLGAYEFGRLVFSAPIAAGERGNETPRGEFRLTAAHRLHQSNLYTIEGTTIPYPMHYALRFHINEQGVGFWIHGRDLPGAPASHGCIGLYDEAMQKDAYGVPEDPVLDEARRLYEWVLGRLPDEGQFIRLRQGPRILILGLAPGTGAVE